MQTLRNSESRVEDAYTSEFDSESEEIREEHSD